MKNLVYALMIILSLVSVSCRKHVYSTYYGEFDIDTLKRPMFTEEHYPCYTIKIIERDSIFFDSIVKYLPSPAEILYCPEKNCYYKLMPVPDEIGVYDFDPTFDYHAQ